MVDAVLDAASYDPTVINGGIINAYGNNARLGEGEWMVVEADESDGTFVKLPSTIAVVTNIDPEHLDYWGEFDKERAAFDAFVENVPFYGVAILCSDHGEVQSLIGRVSDRRILTYGQNPQADVRAVDMRFENGGATFTAVLSERLPGGPAEIPAIHLPMPCGHNVNIALAAIAVAGEMLGRGRYPGRLQSPHHGRCHVGDQRRIVGEGAHAHVGVLRVGIDVTNGRIIHVDTHGRQFLPLGVANPRCQLCIPGGSQDHVARKLGAGLTQGHQLSSLLIGSDEQGRLIG
jgi:hypothetical protein